MALFLPHPEPVLLNRDMFDRPAPIPPLRIRQLTFETPDIQKRQSSSSSSGSDSDSDNSASGSNAPTSSGSSVTPIVIGVVVPVLIIAIIMFVIWKRRQRITRVEELNDKYKSLDFGVDEAAMMGRKKPRKQMTQPEMSIQDLKGSLRKDRGLSLDLGTNPYILPPELHQSRESLHSLSRSHTGTEDKYRATNFIPDDGSIRSPSSLRDHDNASIWTGATRTRAGTMETESQRDLLPRLPAKDVPLIRKPEPAATTERGQGGLLAPAVHEIDRNSTVSTNSTTAAMRASNNYLGQYISGGQKKEQQPGLMVTEHEVEPSPPLNDGPQELPVAYSTDEAVHNYNQNAHHENHLSGHGIAELAGNPYHDDHEQQPTIPEIHTTSYEMDAAPQQQFPKRTQSVRTPAHASTDSQAPPVPNINVQQPDTRLSATDYVDDAASDYYDEEVKGEDFEDYRDYMSYMRQSMLGTRPLPPDDPSENPEQRANRIRSFYKEYFEETGKNSAARQTYYDGSEQYDNYEQYDDFDYGYYEQSHSRGPSIRSEARHRAYSQGSRFHPPGPRAFSSMSGRMGPRQPLPKKKLPPPKALMMLPTPHKLKDDDFLPNAIDFAPPQVFKNQRSGTPDSMRGGMRPYSPSVRPHVPLVSSFDDLAVVPSPHALRKSGLFTALDFAPPRRFKEPGSAASDSGSIRSNGSSMSRMHLASIRNGAYRVSRIPTDVAGTKNDMYNSLRPKWDMRSDNMGSMGMPQAR